MKYQELENLGFHKTPLKGYYSRHVLDYDIILQKLSGGKAGLLLSIREDDRLVRQLDRMQIHSDYIKQTYVKEQECGIVLRFASMTSDELDSLIDTLVSFLQEHHIPQICHLCKQEKPVRIAVVGGEMEILCADCLAHQEDIKTVKTKPLAGTFGSLLCCLMPALLWGLGYRLGYLMAVDGVLFALCGYFGYAFFGEGMDNKGCLLSWLAILTSWLMGEYLSLAFSVKEAYTSQMGVTISLREALSIVPAFLDNTDIAASILTYFFYVMVVTIVTWMIIHVIYSRRQKRKMTLKV